MKVLLGNGCFCDSGASATDAATDADADSDTDVTRDCAIGKDWRWPRRTVIK